LKNVLTFRGGGQLGRNVIFVLPQAGKFISPPGAASSGTFPDALAPGWSLDYLWVSDSTRMPDLRFDTSDGSVQGFPRPFKAIKAYPSLLKGFLEKNYFIVSLVSWVKSASPAIHKKGRNCKTNPIFFASCCGSERNKEKFSDYMVNKTNKPIGIRSPSTLNLEPLEVQSAEILLLKA
jgi:hypothetical protein